MESLEQAIFNTSFNWFDQLNKSDEQIDWVDLQKRAASWVTCAVGNQCVKIPRDNGGKPYDKLLSTLGSAFSWAIRNKSKSTALDLLRMIEKRSIELLTMMEEANA